METYSLYICHACNYSFIVRDQDGEEFASCSLCNSYLDRSKAEQPKYDISTKLEMNGWIERWNAKLENHKWWDTANGLVMLCPIFHDDEDGLLMEYTQDEWLPLIVARLRKVPQAKRRLLAYFRRDQHLHATQGPFFTPETPNKPCPHGLLTGYPEYGQKILNMLQDL